MTAPPVRACVVVCVCVCVCVCVRMFVCVCARVCVCVRERESFSRTRSWGADTHAVYKRTEEDGWLFPREFVGGRAPQRAFELLGFRV